MDWVDKILRGDFELNKEDLNIGRSIEVRERKWKKEDFDFRMRISVEGNI